MPAPAALSCHPHVAITQWAVAGSVLGYPVHVVFQDYPAPIIAALYRKHASWLRKEKVFSVFGLRDFHQLGSKLDAVRLVLLFDPKQLVKTCWLLDMHRSAAEKDHKSSPSLFSNLATNAVGDLPGPTLVLHGYSPRAKSVEAWLEPDSLWPSLPVDSPPAFEFHPRLAPLVASGNPRPESPLGLRDRQILTGLLAGAALVQKGQENDAHLLVELEVYRAVYKALQSTATQPIDEVFDPLALAMVRRANVFLAMKAKSGEPKVARTDAVETDHDQEQRTITRREVADLGNPRGRTVKSLVEFLLQQGAEGLGKFRSIGMNRAIAEKQHWPSQDVEQLVRLLLPWGPKQVRTRFAYLQVQGLITAERAAANQPWIYRLPEALSSANSPFRSLPKPDELERGAIAGGKEVP